MTCYSIDLREKIVAAYQEGHTSIRQVARRFRVSPYTVQRYLNQDRDQGHLLPKKLGSHQKSVLSQYAETARQVVEEHPDWTLWQYCDDLTEKLGVNISTSMMDRFCHEHGLSLKKRRIEVKKSKPKLSNKSESSTGNASGS
jgi:transposase